MKKSIHLLDLIKKEKLDDIPIWFGERWLGTIGILTPFKLLKIFQRYLSEIENLYIDDQLLHVLNLHKANGKKEAEDI
jgi:hypothetical protein